MKYSGLLPNSSSTIWGVIALAIVIAYGSFSFYGMTSLQKTAERVNHTNSVINTATEIEKNIIDLETGQRGFLITGNDSFLEPYYSAHKNLTNLFSSLRIKVSNNPEQVARLEKVENILEEWFVKAGDREIDERRKVLTGAKDADYLQALLREGTGRNILDQIRASLSQLDEDFRISSNQDARNLLLKISKNLVDMETGQRGYLITGLDEFLEPYNDGKLQLDDHVRQIHAIIDNAYDRQIMAKNIAAVDTLATQWLTLAGDPEIKIRREVNAGTKTYQDIERKISQKQGKNILDSLRIRLSDMNNSFNRAHNQHGEILLLAIAKALVDQETGQRGYLITGNDDFLEPFINGQNDFQTNIEALQTLVANAYDMNAARRTIDKIELLAKDWLNLAGMPEIQARKEMNENSTSLKDVVALVEVQTGKEIMDEIRAVLTHFIQTETQLMKSRQKDADKISQLTLGIILFGTLAIVVFAVVIMRTSKVLQKQTNELQIERSKLEQQDWVKTSYAEITSKLQGLRDLSLFAQILLNELIPKLNAHLGLFYFSQQDDNNESALNLLGSYAYTKRKSVSNSYRLGESLVGQCALEKKAILLTNTPEDYIQVTSGSGASTPNNIIVFPLLFEDQVLAVVEVASLAEFTAQHQDLIDQLTSNGGVIFNNINAQIRTQQLLTQSQTQSEELQTQQEELQYANENLEEQTQRLTASEEELKQQTEELRIANEEMKEKQGTLKKQADELQIAKTNLEKNARDLTQASKYKTEFLANMSHELRTPLNSLLILSKELTKNKEGNLNENQIEDVSIIYEGGQSLLSLINDIMDLSKVEAGMLAIQNEPVDIENLCNNLGRLFNGVATSKGLSFNIKRDESAPLTIESDELRLEQILKNFFSNAFKFTEKGSVKLHIYTPDDSMVLKQKGLLPKNCVAFSVTDTGIGIPEDKQIAIFEAFQQEDGSTSRKYGGTGLGLTISRELATLLGGEITLKSIKGEGCTFTVILPIKNTATDFNKLVQFESQSNEADSGDENTSSSNSAASTPESSKKPNPSITDTFVADDRRNIHKNDSNILIIEDDKQFAKIMLGIAHEHKFKCIVTNKGREGVFLAAEHLPDGILLDIGLPDIDGIEVIEQLKFNLQTRHIPVHVMSGQDRKQISMQQGAISFLEKPIDENQIEKVFSEIVPLAGNSSKNILVVEDDLSSQKAIERLIKSVDVELHFASTGAMACEKLESERYDCVILDLGLPDVSGLSVLNRIDSMESYKPPVIIYTGQEITDEDQLTLSKFAADIIIKGAESPERLLDDVSLFIHSVATNLPDDQKKTISMLHNEDAMLRGRKIMLVDDDMRNVFAMSRQLGEAGLDVTMADNGQTALDLLNAQTEEEQRFELILMDIMMPVMDGYEAMQQIRQIPKYKQVPIIALTAKAMPEDRAKCLDAGASEYIIKPVDMERLLSMLRVWLYRHN